MKERIKKLREQSLNATEKISSERARLITEFYKSEITDKVSTPVARAMAFKYILENKEILINVNELIVGEKGPEPKATPTYPEICVHSLNDLQTLDTREKISFKVSEETKKVYSEEIIPFWKSRAIRDRIFQKVDHEWIDAYDAGVFTEFQEQRAPGHTVAGRNIFQKGMTDFIREIRQSIDKLDFYNDPEAYEKREQLTAMRISCEGLIGYAHRYAEKAEGLSKKEFDPQRKEELEEMSEICRTVPEHAPQTFRQALQHYWFIHLGVTTELNTWDSFNPGRLDQNLYPFYKKETDKGTLSPETAKELLQAFWVKFNNQPAPPKVGVTAQESATYTDFCLINIGGVKEDGSDAVNELSYLILDVIEEMRILQPSSMVQMSKKNPDRFLKRALKIIKTGFGQPSIFNTDEIIQELVRQGKSIIDARNGGSSGCVETGAFGKESYILTGYFNLVKVLEITLNNGTDPRTGKSIGIKTGDPSMFKTYDELFDAFRKQLCHFIDIKIKGNLIIERMWATILPAPFLSVIIDDCIKKGKDYNAGGARYNTAYIQGVGMGTITDCLTSIKYNIFDHKSLSMKELLQVLKNNFQGSEKIRGQFISETPKYGNDDDYADIHLQQVFEEFFQSVDGRPTTKGGQFRINLLPTTCHVYFGSVIGATPDGRKAGLPLSEGISPVQGADQNGPTAVFKSAAKIDHIRTGGTLLNQKFTPQLLAEEQDLDKMVHLIRSYFKMDGHHVQFNVVTAKTLRKAQKNPEQYRDLIVRVAGYSDYFIDLGPELQEEIIIRTEQQIY